MWSEKEIDAPAFSHRSFDLNPTDILKLKSGSYVPHIENDALVWKLQPKVKRREELDALKLQLEQANSIPQLKEALRNFLLLAE